MELRIYYECYEQALFIRNTCFLEQKFKNFKITLIKKIQQRKNNYLYSKNVNEIYSIKNPDLVITYTNEGEEKVIFIIEFSCAVHTEDHELQRADNFMPAINTSSIYIKISSDKKTTSKMGGNTKFDSKKPFAVIYKKYSNIFFHFSWSVDTKQTDVVRKNNKYHSMPINVDNLKSLLCEFYIYLENNEYILPENWNIDIIKNITSPNLKDWINEIKNYKLNTSLKGLNSTRVNYHESYKPLEQKNIFQIKFNRLGHAMDPERGMLAYYTLLHPRENIVCKFVFDPSSDTWFSYTPNEEKIRQMIEKIGKNKFSMNELVKFFFLGQSLDDVNMVIDKITDKKNQIIDIDDYLEMHFNDINNNAFKSLIKNSAYIELSNGKDSIFLKYRKWNDVKDFSLPDITTIEPADITNFKEDEITFLTTHKFHVNAKNISISYPGAQGDRPFLVGSGKKVKRINVDIVKVDGSSLVLIEVKDNISKIKPDIEKLQKFKDYRDEIDTYSEKYKFTYKGIKLGVSFSCKKKDDIKNIIEKYNLSILDFFIVLFIDNRNMCLYKGDKIINSVDIQSNDIDFFKVSKNII